MVSVRYIVDDVDEAVEFYSKHLDFQVTLRAAPGFAALQRGDLKLLLNAPGAGGAGQGLPDGTAPEPGGWNRFQIEVQGLEALVTKLKEEGATFRNEIVKGRGGQQVLLTDPAGNLIELFEAYER